MAGLGRTLIECLLQALQCFQEAATEVEKEEFLLKLAGGEEEEAAVASPRLQYFNKVRARAVEALVRRLQLLNSPGPTRCCDYWRMSGCPSL